MTYFDDFEVNTYFNKIDGNYDKYIFKLYGVNYNVLSIVNGVGATIFASNY